MEENSRAPGGASLLGSPNRKRGQPFTSGGKARVGQAQHERPQRLIVSCLEQSRIEIVPLQQVVELAAIALREPRRLAHVASGQPQQLRQVVELEALLRIVERCEFL